MYLKGPLIDYPELFDKMIIELFVLRPHVRRSPVGRPLRSSWRVMVPAMRVGWRWWCLATRGSIPPRRRWGRRGRAMLMVVVVRDWRRFHCFRKYIIQSGTGWVNIIRVLIISLSLYWYYQYYGSAVLSWKGTVISIRDTTYHMWAEMHPECNNPSCIQLVAQQDDSWNGNAVDGPSPDGIHGRMAVGHSHRGRNWKKGK